MGLDWHREYVHLWTGLEVHARVRSRTWRAYVALDQRTRLWRVHTEAGVQPGEFGTAQAAMDAVDEAFDRRRGTSPDTQPGDAQ